MRILAIDTSGRSASVAIAEDGAVLARHWLAHGKTHAEALMPLIESALAGLGFCARDIDAIAAVVGPGSFTGLRVGVSCAKGMAHALRIPTIAVSAMDALALALAPYMGAAAHAHAPAPKTDAVARAHESGRRAYACPMTDARNRQVYAAIYEYCDEIPGYASVMPPCALPVDELIGRLTGAAGACASDSHAMVPHATAAGCGSACDAAPGPGCATAPGQDGATAPGLDIAIATASVRVPAGACGFLALNGDAAAMYHAEISSALGCHVMLAAQADLLPDAARVAEAAWLMAKRGEFTQPSALVPMYLRQTQAERLRREKLASHGFGTPPQSFAQPVSGTHPRNLVPPGPCAQPRSLVLPSPCTQPRNLVPPHAGELQKGSDLHDSGARSAAELELAGAQSDNGFVVVRAGAERIAEILIAERECFADPWSERAYVSEFKNGLARYFVCLSADDGKMAGFCGYWRVGREAQVMKLAVMPLCRGHGAGKALLQAMLEDARREGCERAELEVRSDNAPALGLYSAFGFSPVSVRKGYYALEGKDAVNLSLGIAACR